MGALQLGRPRSKRNISLFKILIFLFLSVCAAAVLFPFILMISTSFKPIKEVYLVSTNILPLKPILANYVEVFTQSLLLRYLLNGVIVTIGTLIGQLIIIIPAAYTFAKLSFRGKNILFVIVLAALVFPRYIAAVPNFLLLSKLRLINTYLSLILPFIGSPFGIFLMRQYFLQIPLEYFDAARLDGCNLFQMLTRVLIPLIRPAIGAFSIFSIVTHWNDFFWPLIVIQTSKMFTPPAGIVYFADAEAGTKWNVVMAAAVAIIAPLVIAFFIGRKQFISSLTHVTMKG